MDDQPTCGKGLAHNSVFPAKVGELFDAIGGMLETHMKALDLTDPASRQEHDAYRRLAETHRQIASQLAATAREMLGDRTLPMGRHDMTVMQAPATRAAFAAVVGKDEELLALLRQTLEEHRPMLAGMASGT